MGEALALLAGRRTYELRRTPTGVALWRRTQRHISKQKASEQCIVVADHECNSPPLPQVIVPTPTKRKAGDDDKPPF
jgi:hypothetical protein